MLIHREYAGRVKKCSTKAVELLELGSLNAMPGWFNVGYIFPTGFCSRTLFRSSVSILPYRLAKRLETRQSSSLEVKCLSKDFSTISARLTAGKFSCLI